MPVGQALQEFVIEGLVGEGGFGIVYLARDTRLDRRVALKEYMPTNLAQRGDDRGVTVRSERYRETFVLGLRSFVNEAKLLASFDHPSLVKVYRFWEENGTAYMVMPYYEGPTLRQQLAELGKPPDEAWLRALLAPLIDALELIHADHCWHRDIAPDNILLLTPTKTQAGTGPQLRPLLLDFGAARRVIGDVTHNLTVILKPGYAPLEQYAESESMRQGAWTDVYALCAVLYCAVTGRAPVPSVSRVLSDDMVSAVQAGAGRYSPAFLAVIDAGLAVRPDARPQSMAALRERFDLGRARGGLAQPPLQPREQPPAQPAAPVHMGASGSTQAAMATAAAARGVGAAQSAAAPASDPSSHGPAAELRPAIERGRAPSTPTRWPLVLMLFGVMVVAAAAFGWWLQRSTVPKAVPMQASEPPSPLAQPQAPPAALPGTQASPATTETAVGAVPPSVPAAAVPTAVPAPAVTAPALTAPALSAPNTAAPAVTLPPPVAARTPASTVATSPAATTRPAPRPRPMAVEVAAPARPPVTERPAGTDSAAPTKSTAPAPAAPPALDAKRFECEVLVRAGQKALANRSYDDAMQRADEAQSVFPDCPGAADLGRNARQAKDKARASTVIQ